MIHRRMLPRPPLFLEQRVRHHGFCTVPLRVRTTGAGDFNANLAGLQVSEQDEEIAASLAAAGLKDMSEHFHLCQCLCTQYVRTWSMIHLGREVL